MKIKLKLTTAALMAFGMNSAFAAEDGDFAMGMEQPKAFQEVLSPEELQAQQDMLNGGATYWLFTAASSATPYQSGYTTTYAGGGCMNAVGNGSAAWMDQNINIPDGHEITFMRFYYIDSNAADDTRAVLFRMNGDGTFTSLETRVSDTDTGAASVGASMSHVVDNTQGALVLRFEGVDDSQIEACGVRFVVVSN